MSPTLLRAIAATLEAEATRLEASYAERKAQLTARQVEKHAALSARLANEHTYERKMLGHVAHGALRPSERKRCNAIDWVDTCTKCGVIRIPAPWRFYVGGVWLRSKPPCSLT